MDGWMEEAKPSKPATSGHFILPAPGGFSPHVSVNMHRAELRLAMVEGRMEGWRGATLCGHFYPAVLRASEPECNSPLPYPGTDRNDNQV